MADISLTQAEADALIAMEKHRLTDEQTMPVPMDRFSAIADVWTTFEDFLGYCNITQPPCIDRGLFT